MLPKPVSRRALAVVLWVALLGWACAILWLSSLSPREMPDAAFLLMDKINHVLAYALGGWLAAGALRLSLSQRPAIPIVLAVVIVGAFGALDEAVQTFTPGRMGGDVGDWIADLIGAGVGALISLLTQGRLEKLARNHDAAPAPGPASG